MKHTRIVMATLAVLTVAAVPAFGREQPRDISAVVTSDVAARTATFTVGDGIRTANVTVEGTRLLTKDGYSLETTVVQDDVNGVVVELTAHHGLTQRSQVAAVRIDRLTGQRTESGVAAAFRLLHESRHFALFAQTLSRPEERTGTGRFRIASQDEGSGCAAATFKLAAASGGVVARCSGAAGPVTPLACAIAIAAMTCRSEVDAATARIPSRRNRHIVDHHKADVRHGNERTRAPRRAQRL